MTLADLSATQLGVLGLMVMEFVYFVFVMAKLAWQCYGADRGHR